MIAIKTDYPVFEANQVLTSDHLNSLLTYLDEQNRLTRVALYGIGVGCGLEVGVGGKGNIITISKGYGVTSKGYLVSVGTEDFVADRYKDYTLRNEGVDDLVVSELLDKQHNNYDEGTALTASFLQGKVVLLFVELLEESLRNCTPNSCDDKGKRVDITLRKLLISEDQLEELNRRIAHNLDEAKARGDYFPNLTARINLPDLRLPRLDIPASNMEDAQTILDAYRRILSPGAPAPTLFERVGSALDEAYAAFKPILSPLTDGNYLSGKVKNIKVQYENTLDTVIYSQYYYDFLDDLIQAYDEFRWKAVELMALCSPPVELFPRHLELGETGKGNFAGEKVHRHYFRPSPALADQKRLGEEVRSLFQRLRLMVESFNPVALVNMPAREAPVRITPSKMGDVPLSEKAIPYYYDLKTSPSLPAYWNIRKTRTGRPKAVAGYNVTTEYHLDNDPDLLNYDLEKYNFLRIEGHIGRDCQDVLKQLLVLKSEYRLPIEFVLLRAGKGSASTEADSMKDFLTKHSGIQHKAGVPISGTFVLVCHDSPGSSVPGRHPEAIHTIAPGSIIADFFLPYRVVESECQCQVLVRECEYEWIDSIRHINNLTLRDYRFDKEPKAAEAERAILQNSYVITIYKYVIQGIPILPRGETKRIEIPRADLKQKKLSAVARKLNEIFPLGLVFDHKPNSNKLLIRRLEGQSFRIELSGLQGNQIRYAYENDKVYRWHHKTWEELDRASDYGVVCRVLGDDYQEAVYKWVHENENFRPRYPEPAPSPTAAEAIEWERMTLKRARRYADVTNLPIHGGVLSPLANEIIRILGLGVRIILIGSWANGSWVSRTQRENYDSLADPGDGPDVVNQKLSRFLDLRKKVTGKTGYSDIDLLIEREYEITPDMIKFSSDYGINIFKGKKGAQKGLVLIEGDEI